MRCIKANSFSNIVRAKKKRLAAIVGTWNRVSICIFCGTNSYSKVKTKFNPVQTGAGRNPLPPKVFLRNSKTPQDIEKKLSDFNFTPLTVILHVLSITIVIRCCYGNLSFSVCQIIFWMKKQRNLNYFQDNYLIKLRFAIESYF